MLSTNTPAVASWTKKRPFRTGSEAVTTPVTVTFNIRDACSAGREITAAAFVKTGGGCWEKAREDEVRNRKQKIHQICGAGARPASLAKLLKILCLLMILTIKSDFHEVQFIHTYWFVSVNRQKIDPTPG